MTGHGLPDPSEPTTPLERDPMVPRSCVLFDPGLDRGALERMLLASAAHPSGAGFTRAHLMVWNADRGSLDGRLAWVAGSSRTLEEVLVAARQQASDGTDPEATRRLRMLRIVPSELTGPSSGAWISRRSDIGRDPGAYPWGEAPMVGVVPLVRDAHPYGLVIGEWCDPEHAIERAAAIEAWRALANGALVVHSQSELTRRRGDQTRALAGLARAAVSSLNLAELANTLVRLAAHATGARGAVLWRVAGEGKLELSSSYGPAGARDRLGRGLTPLAARAIASGRPLEVERAVDAEDLPAEIAAQLSTAVALPLTAYGRTSGALVVYDRLTHHPNDRVSFDAEDLAFLVALADQCALAFEQARGEATRHRLEQTRRDLLRQLGRSERRASRGESSVSAAHQARNPLASIGAFARRVHRSLAEDDPNREYLEVVVREADRLERMLSQPLELEGVDGPRLEVQSVNTLLQEALQGVGEQLVRRRVRLLKRLSPDLPPLLLDRERMRRVIQNVLGQALDRVGVGGRIRVESRRVQQFVVVEVANDGLSQPGEMLAELFVPFALQGKEGADLGLAMARQVVWEHGGEVRVRSEGEWSTVFALTLPVRSNEDRRRPGTERRVTRGDRRLRTPAA